MHCHFGIVVLLSPTSANLIFKFLWKIIADKKKSICYTKSIFYNKTQQQRETAEKIADVGKTTISLEVKSTVKPIVFALTTDNDL